jgi:hypothetical protein
VKPAWAAAGFLGRASIDFSCTASLLGVPRSSQVGSHPLVA